MKLFSINNERDRLERQRDEASIQRLRDVARRAIQEATMDPNGLTPCPGCGGLRPYQQRLCERCLLAEAGMSGATIEYAAGEGPRARPVRRPSPEPRRSVFAQAFRDSFALESLHGDNPQGTRMVELRLQGQAARKHGDAAIRHGRRARFTLARSLEDSRQAHGINPNGALAVALLMVAAVFGLLWWAADAQQRVAEQPATVSPTLSAW